MKITKQAHANVEIEKQGTRIVIDPGVFDKKVHKILKEAAAVLITHKHGDHFDKKAVEEALAEDPNLTVYGPISVVEELGSHGGRVIIANPGDSFTVGSLEIKVYGGEHAPIHHSMPVIDNVAYLVDGSVYHPGDSFSIPEGEDVKTLLLPTGGPWMKPGEALDFALALKPERILAIHDMTDSEIGNQIANDIFGPSGVTGIEFIQLKPGKSIDV